MDGSKVLLPNEVTAVFKLIKSLVLYKTVA